MLEICNKYAADNHIYFNSMKTVCIKNGDPVMEYEKALLNGVHLSWTDIYIYIYVLKIIHISEIWYTT